MRKILFGIPDSERIKTLADNPWGDEMTETLVLTTPDYGDGLVLVPADSIAAIRGSINADGEPQRVEDCMLDDLDPSIVSALLDSHLARVEEPLGHHEILVIDEAGRAEVVALVESMGYVVQQDCRTSQSGHEGKPSKRLVADVPQFAIAALRHSRDKASRLFQYAIDHFRRAARR